MWESDPITIEMERIKRKKEEENNGDEGFGSTVTGNKIL